MSDITVSANWTKRLLLALGWVFMVLGVLGLFLPVLQGVLFLLIGLIILSSEYVWAHHLLLKVKERFPHLSRRGHEIALKTKTWLHRHLSDSRVRLGCARLKSYEKTGTDD